MITKEINTTKKIINNANYKIDFTINIGKENSINNRYIVSCFNLYKGKNPSLEFNLYTKVNDIIKNTNMFDSIGGWFNVETNSYFLDCNMPFDNIDFALKFAKVNDQVAIYDKLEKRVIYLKK